MSGLGSAFCAAVLLSGEAGLTFSLCDLSLPKVIRERATPKAQVLEAFAVLHGHCQPYDQVWKQNKGEMNTLAW